MPLIIPNTIENDTPADAAELQQNFATIQAYVNTNLVNRDGSVALTAPLVLPGDPTQNNHAANKGYVDGRDAEKQTAIDTKVAKAGDTVTGQIKGITPVADEDLTRKDYVDSTTVSLAGDTMTGPLLLPTVQSANVLSAVHRDWVTDTFVAITGEQMTGALLLRSPQDTNAEAATRKDYVDSTTVSLAGDTMTGQLNVGHDAFDRLVGVSAAENGALGSLRGTNGVNLQLFKAGTAYVSGGHYAGFFGQDDTTIAGTITKGTGNTVSFVGSSDYRLKEVLGPVDDPVNRLLQLKPVHFRWLSDDSQQDGFLAHEVQAVVPEAATGTKDGAEMQGLDPGKLVPLLVAAVQELAARVAELEAAS